MIRIGIDTSQNALILPTLVRYFSAPISAKIRVIVLATSRPWPKCHPGGKGQYIIEACDHGGCLNFLGIFLFDAHPSLKQKNVQATTTSTLVILWSSV